MPRFSREYADAGLCGWVSLSGATAGFMLAYQQSAGELHILCMYQRLATIVDAALYHGACGTFMQAVNLHAIMTGRLMGFFPNDGEVEAGLAKQR